MKNAIRVATMAIGAVGLTYEKATCETVTGIQIPVIVNLYKDGGSEADARKAIEEANKLLKGAGFKMNIVDVVDLSKDGAPVGGDTGRDGEFGTRAERDAARTYGNEELDKNAKNKNKGKGVKISFTKKASGDDDRGVSVHRNRTMLVRQSTAGEGGAQDTGQTLAHELGHILTIKGHSAGADDIMQATGKGTKFTKEQIAEMQKFDNKYMVGKCATQWSSAYGAEKDKQQFGAKTDALGDLAAGVSSSWLDINQVILMGLDAGDHTGQDTSNVHGLFSLNGVLPVDAFSARYALGFDIDANTATGTALAGGVGFDRLAYIDVSRDGSGLISALGTIVDDLGTEMGTFAPTFEIESEFSDPNDASDPTATSFMFELSKSDLGLDLAIEVPVAAAAGVIDAGTYAISDDLTDVVFDLQKWLDDPILKTFGNGVPTPGELYPFEVGGLEPNAAFKLYLDDLQVFNGTLGDTGGYSGSFSFPVSLPVNSFYFLTAQDETGEFAYSITCPVPLPSASLMALAGMTALAGVRAVRGLRRPRER